MSNIPMIPMTFAIDDYTVIINNGSRLTITKEGDMWIDGSVKDAALGIIKYIIEPEFSDGVISWELNNALRIEYDDQFTIEYIKPNKPACWDELEKEFYRIVKMKAFW
jgi:hypothetical protein